MSHCPTPPVYDMLRSLGLRRRESVTLAAKWHEGPERTNVELAERFGVKPGAISNRISRALDKLAASDLEPARRYAAHHRQQAGPRRRVKAASLSDIRNV